MITIINYGMGNIESIVNMLKRIGQTSMIAYQPEEIKRANKLILPGVGAFDAAVKELERRNLVAVLNEKVLNDKTPVLGICLGMQLLGVSSEEGKKEGLGWVDARCSRFESERLPGLKIPCMGWNYVTPVKENPLFKGLQHPKFYFVHSYHMVCSNEENVIAAADYGYTYTVAVRKENIYGVQFHPEKSHKYGMQLLKNFTEI